MTSRSPRHKLAHEIRGERFAQLQIERGKAPLQLGQCCGQQIRSDRRDGAELEHARKHALLMLGVVDKIAHRGKDRPRAPHDLLALAGELHAGLAPLYEAEPELVLELLDLHAERRLAHGAGLRRMAEMARFG